MSANEELLAGLTVQQFASAELLGKFYVRQGSVELLGKAEVKNIGSAELLGNAEIIRYSGITHADPGAQLTYAEYTDIPAHAITADLVIGNWRLISTVTDGTVPMIIVSTTAVANLNADLLDGLHASEIGGLKIEDYDTSAVATDLNAAALDDQLGFFLHFYESNLEWLQDIIGDANMTVAEIAAMFDETDITVEQIIQTLGSDYVAGSKVYDILNAMTDDDRVQEILYRWVEYHGITQQLATILADGAGDTTLSGDTTISATTRYEALVCTGGFDLIVDTKPIAIIAETIEINDTGGGSQIRVDALGGAGGATGTDNPGDGGVGAGNLFIFCGSLTIDPTEAITVLGGAGIAGTLGSDNARGGAGVAGAGKVLLRHAASGSGGRGGGQVTAGQGAGGGGPMGGGGGGGSDSTHDGGAGPAPNWTYFDGARDLFDEFYQYAVDWVIVNVMGKTPATTVAALPDSYGSGGGAGGTDNNEGYGGGGGGGGGYLVLMCAELNNEGIISVDGGPGGAAGSEGVEDSAGGGGGGGILYLFFNEGTLLGDLSADGGAVGAGNDTPEDPEVGGTSLEVILKNARRFFLNDDRPPEFWAQIPYIVTDEALTNTWETVLDIEGSGYLISVAQVSHMTGGNAVEGIVRVTKDGVQLGEEFPLTTSGQWSSANFATGASLTTITRFERSMLVEHRGDTGDLISYCTVAFVLDDEG